MSLLHLLEPEESVGNLWHRLVGGASTVPHFADAAVGFDEVVHPLRVFFRGVGGEAGVELKSAVSESSHHRLNRRVRLGVRSERVSRARYNRERFSLPGNIDAFPERALNEGLYYWLAAWTAAARGDPPLLSGDVLHDDLARIEHAMQATRIVLRRFPGLAKHYEKLRMAALEQRPDRQLPPAENYVEQLIRSQLAVSGTDLKENGRLPSALEGQTKESAPRGYKTYLPVPLWGEIEDAHLDAGAGVRGEEAGSGRTAAADGKSRRGRRRDSDQVQRKGGFFVHRFEKILTWTEFMNLHRHVEDDDEEAARKAADDHDEIGVGEHEKKAATRLAIDLHLAPADVDAERISDHYTYPEWDFRRRSYLPNCVRILEHPARSDAASSWQPDAKAGRRIRAVRRQFEALRPRRELLGRQLDGHELDMDGLIRSYADIKARGEGSDRVFRQTREQARDLAVAVLMDASRSTESYVENRSVIDIEREALLAFAEGLSACGDPAAIFAFSSLRRDRVFMTRLKDFDEPGGLNLRARISAVRPGFYTRLGAAIRHGSAVLAKRNARKRLLLVLTDGKPNDIDHYEGRFGLEDSKRAVQEARQMGQTVFGITIDSQAQGYFPFIFGAGGFAIVSRPARLTSALPVLYRHLVT